MRLGNRDIDYNKLEELHQLLQKNEKVTVSAIAGMGGIGKSELALQYALAYQNEYPGSLCWFSVRGENIGTQIIEYAASYLDIFAPDELKSDSGKVQYCWRNWRSETSLIVLDDVPDYGEYYRENVEPYLPPSTNLLIDLKKTSSISLLKLLIPISPTQATDNASSKTHIV